MFSTRKRLLALAGIPAVLLIAVTAAASASNTPPAQRSQVAYLLCGTFTPGADQFSGNSNVDHPSGASATGTVQQITSAPTNGDACDNASGNDMFTWTIQHDNVQLSPTNPNYERGTEHGVSVINLISGADNIGFNGQITNYDFQESGDTCNDSDGRTFFYASGHAQSYTGCPAASDAPGNINTHGGASTGQHFNGTYGTLVYQNNDNDNDDNGTTNSCSTGSATYCFEAVLIGFVN